jgi:hypothetical protein
VSNTCTHHPVRSMKVPYTTALSLSDAPHSPRKSAHVVGARGRVRQAMQGGRDAQGQHGRVHRLIAAACARRPQEAALEESHGRHLLKTSLWSPPYTQTRGTPYTFRLAHPHSHGPCYACTHPTPLKRIFRPQFNWQGCVRRACGWGWCAQCCFGSKRTRRRQQLQLDPRVHCPRYIHKRDSAVRAELAMY